MDAVAFPLALLIMELDSLNIKYTLTRTRPVNNTFAIQDDNFYVLRQKQDSEGVYHFVIAAKMGKEPR